VLFDVCRRGSKITFNLTPALLKSHPTSFLPKTQKSTSTTVLVKPRLTPSP
jgi:hypothetical protein